MPPPACEVSKGHGTHCPFTCFKHEVSGSPRGEELWVWAILRHLKRLWCALTLRFRRLWSPRLGGEALIFCYCSFQNLFSCVPQWQELVDNSRASVSALREKDFKLSKNLAASSHHFIPKVLLQSGHPHPRETSHPFLIQGPALSCPVLSLLLVFMYPGFQILLSAPSSSQQRATLAAECKVCIKPCLSLCTQPVSHVAGLH